MPDEVSNSVYARMVKERATVAKSFRSKGKEEAKGITSLAERESGAIIAEAYKKSQEIKGREMLNPLKYADAFSASQNSTHSTEVLRPINQHSMTRAI